MNDHLRIGDAEREQAAAALGEHYAAGRITHDEYSERLDRIYAARTYADLAPQFRDLPSLPGSGSHPAYPVLPSTAYPPVSARGPAFSPPVRRRRGGWPVPLLLIVALLAVTAATDFPIIIFGLLFWVVMTGKHRGTRAGTRFDPRNDPRRRGHWNHGPGGPNGPSGPGGPGGPGRGGPPWQR